jgi:hypothetical protein
MISRNPFASGLKDKRGEPRVLNQIAAGSGSLAERLKNRPMAIAWDNDGRMWL